MEFVSAALLSKWPNSRDGTRVNAGARNFIWVYQVDDRTKISGHLLQLSRYIFREVEGNGSSWDSDGVLVSLKVAAELDMPPCWPHRAKLVTPFEYFCTDC